MLVIVLLGLALLAWMAWWLDRAHAQDKCTPYLLCPYPGAGGTAGRGGAGAAAGLGGTGGRGGGGGTAGAPQGGLVITAALTLEPRVIRTGNVLRASVTYGNTGQEPVTAREIRIAARGPGASHEGGPYTDLAPVLTNVTLAAGQHVKLDASRTFTAQDPVGEWEVYATHQDAAGRWHDAPSERLQVVGSIQPPTGGSGGGSGTMTVGGQLWYVAPWAGTNIYRANVNWASAYANGDDIWNPTFIAELQGLRAFRHMDTNATNFSKISTWSQRKAVTDPRNQEIYIDGSSSPDTTGLAIEWQIDLCNRAALDCWFTHPYLATDDYVTQEATLIKQKLNPALKVYVELSNEVWNGSFSAFQQAINAGKAGGLPGGNEYYQGIAHEMMRALQVFQVYQNVFGTQAMGSRVIRVFSESGNVDLTTQALKNVYKSSQWNPQGQKIDMIALAPYIGSGTSGASETLSRWKGEVDSKTNDPIGWAKQNHADANDIPLIGCYEAGMHHLSSADVWARNSQVYDGYVYMLDRFAEKLNGICMLYTTHGTWESKGAWGLRNHVGQPLSEAHKARATKDWSAGAADRGRDYRIVWLLIAVFVLALLVIAYYIRKAGQADGRLPPPPPPPKDDAP